MTTADDPSTRDVVHVRQSADGQWYFRKVAGNNRKISTGGEGFSSKASAKRAARRAHPGVPVVVDEDKD